MTKFGPCNILKKHDSRSMYKVDFLSRIHVSLVFNILDLTEYHKGDKEHKLVEAQWSVPAMVVEKEEIKEILDSHVGRSTRNK